MACQVKRNEDGSIERVLAPNGQDSLLFQTLLKENQGSAEVALRQYAMVYTPSFKQWFGDWENNPQNSSKVVDSNGEPLIVYHGSELRFSEFKSLIGYHFFAKNRDYAEFYADKKTAHAIEMSPYFKTDLSTINKNIYPVFLNLRNPVTNSHISNLDISRNNLGVTQNNDGIMGIDAPNAAYINEVLKQYDNEYVYAVRSSNQAKSIFNQGTFDQSQNNILLMPAVEEVENGLTKLIHLKENLLDNAKRRQGEVRVEIKKYSGDEARYSGLVKERTSLEKQIEQLEDEIKQLGNLDSKSPEVIGPYIERELARIPDLIEGSVESNKEAADIIRFIKSLADLRMTSEDNNTYGHPIFEREELFDDQGNFIVSHEVEEVYREWDRRANEYESLMLEKDRILATDIVAQNPNVETMYGKGLDYDEIVKSGQGLKDTHWVDMMLMDIGTGIWSRNGIIPQVSRLLINEAFEKQEAWSKDVNEKIDHVLPKVRRALERMGYKVGIPGINQVSYDLFRQVDKHGNFKPNIVSKYSFEYQDQYSDMEQRFQSLYREARDKEGRVERDQAFTRAFQFRNDWLKENTMQVNPALLSTIKSKFPEFDEWYGSDTEVEEHTKLIKDQVGEYHFNKIVEEQLLKIKAYQVSRKNRLEELLAAEGVDDLSKLSRDSQVAMKIHEYENSPFQGALYVDRGKPFIMGPLRINSKLENNVHVPLKEKNGKNLGHYDQSYQRIEDEIDLREFYEIIYGATSGIYDRLDYDSQSTIMPTSILSMERTMLDLFLDKNTKAAQILSIAMRRIIDKLKGAFGVNRQSNVSFAKINAITGLPEYSINDDFIRRNTNKINQLFKARGVIFQSRFNSQAKKKIDRFTKFTTVAITPENSGWLTELVSQYTRMNPDQILANYAQEMKDDKGKPYMALHVGKIIYANVLHEIAQEQSFDLPKIIKNYANLAAQYSARKEILPTLELLKGHYEGISKQHTNNSGDAISNARGKKGNRIEALRENANRQYDNWFERAVLGNYGLRKNVGFVNAPDKEDEDVGESSKITKFLTMLNKGKWDGKIESREDKLFKSEVTKALAAAKDELKRLRDTGQENKIDKAEKLVQELSSAQAGIGKDFAFSGVFDALMNFIRWRGLGFNIPSGMMNVVQGQIANSITASRGNYFPPEYINELTLSEMSIADGLAKASLSRMPKNAAMIKVLMEKYNVLQDASNELQKSSAQSRFKGLSRLNPFYLIKKGEYYNQAPLLAAVLKNTPIIAKDGSISNVKDAMIAVYDDVGKRWTTQLKDAFRTEENIQSWEHANGKDYFKFKSNIRQIIANTHGDFDSLSGMMAKSTHTGQALTMFKTWLPREIYKRLGVQQDNLLTGVKDEKGTYRSHTAASAMVHAGLIGTMAFGPVGGLITAGAGFVAGRYFGAKSNLSFLQELGKITSLMFRKAVGIPLNPISRLIRGKNFINDNRKREFQRMQSPTFTQTDYNNFKANMQDMAMQLFYLASLLMVKAFLWDDDDEPEDSRRQWHNGLANELMKLSSEASMYANPKGMADAGTNMGIIRFFTDFGKAISSLKGLTEGSDTILSGPNKGKSASLTAARKLALPSLIQPGLGFTKLGERQFLESPFDDYFWGDEKEAKNEIKLMKLHTEEKLQEQFPEMAEDDFKKLLNKEFGRKKKGESYTDFLTRLKLKEQESQEDKE